VGNACLHLVATGSGDNRVNRIEVDTSPSCDKEAAPQDVGALASRLQRPSRERVQQRLRKHRLPARAPGRRIPGRENVVRTRLRVETGSDNQGPVISKVRHEPAVPGRDVPSTSWQGSRTRTGWRPPRSRTRRTGPRRWREARSSMTDCTGTAMRGWQLRRGDPCPPCQDPRQLLDRGEGLGGSHEHLPARRSGEDVALHRRRSLESSVYRYRLLINRKNLTAPVTGLATRLLHSDELVPATFIFDESETFYDVGVRYHGSPWNGRRTEDVSASASTGQALPRRSEAHQHQPLRVAQNEGSAYHLIHKASVPDAVAPHSPGTST